jgi:hypothetical protein
MQIKKRKRNISPEQIFTVVANDGPSIEIIEQKAGQNAVEVFRRGHAKNRLYFRCVPEKKEPFLKEISGLCFWEPAVTPPNSILRRYRRDLLKTAINRLDKNAAQSRAYWLGFDNTGCLAVNKQHIISKAGLEREIPDSNAQTCAEVKIAVVLNLPTSRFQQVVNYFPCLFFGCHLSGLKIFSDLTIL